MEDETLTRPSILAAMGNFFFRHRNWLLTVVIIGLFAAFRPTYPRGSAKLDGWLDLAGIAVIVAGQALRALTIGLAYIERGGKQGQVYATKLVTAGLFSHCRNPLYVGNIMVYLGLFIVFNNAMVYLIGIPFILLVYVSIVAAEEKYLRRTFGSEYADYCRQVNRWLPEFRGLRKTMQGMTFSWLRVVLKEYGSTYAWVSGVLAVLVYESLAHSTAERERTRLTALAAIWVAATIGWAVVRYLKLSGRLRYRD
jgi:protein-S-isoprenylcysteine O-methyltransferase Ste14